VGILAGLTDIIPAAGASTTSALAGSSVAAAAILPAAGLATTSALADANAVIEAVSRRRSFAGFPRSHLWIAHINGKRYVGTYEELEAALGEVVEKTARKPRVVIKSGRVVSRGVAQPVVATVEQAKVVQQQLTVDIGPLLAAAVRRRDEEEEDDLMLLL
jgi:hypothetical protein